MRSFCGRVCYVTAVAASDLDSPFSCIEKGICVRKSSLCVGGWCTCLVADALKESGCSTLRAQLLQKQCPTFQITFTRMTVKVFFGSAAAMLEQ